MALCRCGTSPETTERRNTMPVEDRANPSEREKMNTAYGMLLAIATSLGLGFLQPSSSNQDPNDPPEVCKCKVVSKRDFSPKGSEIPKCDDLVTGQSVEAFSVGVVSYPAGQSPKPGVCGDGVCNGQRAEDCTYATMVVNVTVSNCAAQLYGYPAGEYIKVVVERGNPQPWTSQVPPSQQNPLNRNWECTPPDHGPASKCGAGEFTATFRALKEDGTTAFSVFFNFGCGSCKAART